MQALRSLLVLFLSIVLFSCSHDDPKPSIENVSLSFLKNNKVVEVPAAMGHSSNVYAVFTSEYITSMNDTVFIRSLSYFKAPKGAVKSSSPIAASNAPVSSVDKKYIIYTWSGKQDSTIAYQRSEELDKYIFEVFVKIQNNDWYRYSYAEEKKDKSEGFVNFYGKLFSVPSAIFTTYTWSRSNNILDFKAVYTVFLTIEVDILMNEKTKAGSLDYFIEKTKYSRYEWDAKGNGSSISYNQDGSIYYQTDWTL